CLLDLPLRELSNSFEEVILVDIIHMQSVKDAVSIFNNVKTIVADITGVAERLYNKKPKPEGNLPQSEPNFPFCDDDCSLVISLNILSQLPIIPTHYLRRNLNWEETEKLLSWSNDLMLSHYNKLKNLHCPVCIITDWEMIFVDKKGNEIDRQITVPFLAKINPDFQWRWSLAPLGIESKKYSVELSVVVILINH
ncbi:MAG: hypothetical protein N2738_03410, partial [Thermodesulfovibrionales bacterium]|nr:hypothetical protein [Thermodesulfovibrionales bacterium]